MEILWHDYSWKQNYWSYVRVHLICFFNVRSIVGINGFFRPISIYSYPENCQLCSLHVFFLKSIFLRKKNSCQWFSIFCERSDNVQRPLFGHLWYSVDVSSFWICRMDCNTELYKFSLKCWHYLVLDLNYQSMMMSL